MVIRAGELDGRAVRRSIAHPQATGQSLRPTCLHVGAASPGEGRVGRAGVGVGPSGGRVGRAGQFLLRRSIVPPQAIGQTLLPTCLLLGAASPGEGRVGRAGGWAGPSGVRFGRGAVRVCRSVHWFCSIAQWLPRHVQRIANQQDSKHRRVVVWRAADSGRAFWAGRQNGRPWLPWLPSIDFSKISSKQGGHGPEKLIN